MAYYIRVFGKHDPDIPITIIQNSLENSGIQVSVTVETGSKDSWQLISISDKEQNDIVQIERNTTCNNSLGYSELIEFRKDIENCKPQSAVEWLKKQFNVVEVIYAFQILDFSEHTKGWEVISHIKALISNITHGFTQADYEGFSNEEGYQILWQFSVNVKGDWQMAILSASGNWISFKMDLGNKEHQAAFMNGKIPEGITSD